MSLRKKPIDEPRRPPSPRLGHPVFVYVPSPDGQPEKADRDPTFAIVTYEYTAAAFADHPHEGQAAKLAEAHAGYIDVMLFPRDAPPRPLQSVAPADYVLAGAAQGN